ncbi:MAG: family 20 glycosylhydrolase [Bacteroidota bacterium]
MINYLKALVLVMLFISILCENLVAQSTELQWMPVPKEWKVFDEKYSLESSFKTKITGFTNERLEAYATRFMRRLDWRTGLFFPQEKVSISGSNPDFVINVSGEGALELGTDESYILEVGSDRITLTAPTDFGAMRGMETLLQTLQADESGYYFPAVQIKDAPRFPWRGLMIDVARHFQPIEVIKRNLDGMAAVKMNVLHLHLVDDHGFRVESKVFPELHEKASNGEYFTQVEIKEIVQYAGNRGIRVVPEFDIPGHASAFLTAFPELGSADQEYHLQNRSGVFDPTLNPIKEETYEFINGLFTEMAGLFPDLYFHIGGDENKGKHWNENKEIQAFKDEKGFKSNHELQNYFNIRVQKHLKSLGKKMMGWDEILTDDLPKDAVVHSWRGVESLKEASEAGYQCLLSNGYYIDLMKRASDHYTVDPLPENLNISPEASKNILGGEATMWSELVTPETIDSRIWPRTAAIAERFWSPSDIRDINSMYDRMEFMEYYLEHLGLQHIRNRGTLMRNLAGGGDTKPIEALAGVSEPLEGYARNPAGDIYEFHYAFNRFADLTTADAKDARAFTKLVHQYQQDQNENTKEELTAWLEKWKANHEKITELIKKSPALKEVEGISSNLSMIAKVGLAALNQEINTSSYQSTMEILEKARIHGARTELQVVDPIIALVKLNSASIDAKKSTGKVKVDGNLNDWNDAHWGYFVPSFKRNWNDTCHYAVQWDEKNLYFGFKVSNKNIQARKKNRDETGLHQDDGIEILLDTKNDGTTEWKKDDLAYHVNVLNAILDDRGLNKNGEYNSRWNGKAKTKVKVYGSVNKREDKDEGYTVEFAISWKEIGQNPKPGLSLGVNLGVNDSDDLSGEYRYYDFMGLTVFHNPSAFAELVLVE